MYIFFAGLPFRSYTFVAATLDMRQKSWPGANAAMIGFGGTVSPLVLGHLETGDHLPARG